MPADTVPQPADDAVPFGRAGVPAAPAVQPEEIWLGTPNVLLDEGRYTIGWQGWPEKKGGPSYVTVRRSALGALKIVARFPLTDAGWTQAWRALVKLDSATAEAVLPVLAHRAESASGFEERKKLDARSLAFLPEVIFVGGYLAGDELVAGRVYELRFLADRLSVFPRDGLTALAEFSYADVQAVEVAGPGRVHNWTPGQQAMLAAVFGLTGALVAYSSTRIKTFVRIQTADSELFFLHTALLPDDLRIHLSRGIGAVRAAQVSASRSGDNGRQPGSPSLVDELSRLAGLLDGGLLTRDEFDQLKARLIAGH
jgi:hypothetical protein